MNDNKSKENVFENEINAFELNVEANYIKYMIYSTEVTKPNLLFPFSCLARYLNTFIIATVESMYLGELKIRIWALIIAFGTVYPMCDGQWTLYSC